ncbi:hypothetical protein WICPIJ_003325, partial [Wickerhamomyces pijperi]
LAAIESLKKFLQRPKKFPSLEAQKLWKGLFYSMWFSDKPRPQQRLAADLGELFLIIPNQNYKVFCASFWFVICKEWSSIDHHRLDKFLLLVRRVLFNQIKKLKQEEWNQDLVQQFLATLREIPLSGSQKIPNGIPFHLIDIYGDELERLLFEGIHEEEGDEEDEELAKIQEEKKQAIEEAPLKELLKPFEELRKTALFKPLREKIRDDLLKDPRLIEWNAVESSETTEAKSESKSEAKADNSDDEWEGFD